MNVKLLTQHQLEFLNLNAAQARMSLHLSKCHIVGNHMPLLICYCAFSLGDNGYSGSMVKVFPSKG